MIRTAALAALGVTVLWFGLADPSVPRRTVHFVLDKFDDRPARAILFLGHSRVYYNNMPDMVRKLGDSASVAQKYEITMRALPGATLEKLWNDAKVHRLLDEEHWDDVIIQGEARAHANETDLASFNEYGERLIRKAMERGARVALIVSWNFGPAVFSGESAEEIETYDRAIQRDHKVLADRTGAGLINTGVAWRIVSAAEPSIPLDKSDGNHPTLQGSYLSALMVFACLTGSDDFKASYVPLRLPKEQTARIRKAMASGPGTSTICREGKH